MYYPKDKESGAGAPTLCPLLVAATIAHHGQVGDGQDVVTRLSCGPECGWWSSEWEACAVIAIAKKLV